MFSIDWRAAKIDWPVTTDVGPGLAGVVAAETRVDDEIVAGLDIGPIRPDVSGGGRCAEVGDRDAGTFDLELSREDAGRHNDLID